MYILPKLFSPLLIDFPFSLTCAPQYISDLEKCTNIILFLAAISNVWRISGWRSILDLINVSIIPSLCPSQHSTSNVTPNFFMVALEPAFFTSTGSLSLNSICTLFTSSGFSVHEYLSAWYACSTVGNVAPPYSTSNNPKLERSCNAVGENGGGDFFDFE